MSERVSLSVPSRPASLDLVVAVSQQFCRAAGASDAERDAIVRAARRLVAFAIDRSYGASPHGEVRVELELLDRSVHVAVHDWGVPLASFGGGFGPPSAEFAALGEGVEDLRLINLGRDGKTLSFSKAVSAPAQAAAGRRPECSAAGRHTRRRARSPRGARPARGGGGGGFEPAV